MSIPVTCTSCGFSGHAPDMAVGKHVKCRKCGTAILVHRLEPASIPVSAPPTPIPSHTPPAASTDTVDHKPPTTPSPAAEPKAEAPAEPAAGVELLLPVPKQPWYHIALEIAATGYAIAATIIAVLLSVYLIIVSQEQPALMFGGIGAALLFALLSVALAGWLLTFLDIGRDIRRLRKQIDPNEPNE